MLVLIGFQSTLSFKTSTCHHEAIDLVGLDNCINYDSHDTIDQNEVCDMFTPRRECETKHLEGCFENEDVEEIRDQRFSQIRKELMKPYQNHASSFNFIVGMCPNISFENNTQDVTAFHALEFLDTDKNCTKEQLSKFNTGLPKCLERETRNAIKIFGNQTTYSSSADYQTEDNACSVLDRTVGQCLLQPTCFSERELLILSKILSKFLKENYVVVIHDINTGKEIRRIALKDCEAFTKDNIFSTSNMRNPVSSLMFIIGAVVLILSHWDPLSIVC